MNNWVILGAGNLVGDIVDAIETKGDNIWRVIHNQKLTEIVATKLASKNILTMDLAAYQNLLNDKSNSDSGACCLPHIFGFLDPSKQEFLSSLSPYNLKFDNLLHPGASVPRSVTLGVGNYFGPLAVVGTDTVIGNYNYFNRASSVGHDTQVGNFNRLGPAATVCGRCRLGDRNNIGANATVIDGLFIENDVTVGAGGVVTKSLSCPGTYVGIPARLMPKR